MVNLLYRRRRLHPTRDFDILLLYYLRIENILRTIQLFFVILFPNLETKIAIELKQDAFAEES